MIGNVLRTPLIKSAALLIVLSLLVYLTAESTEGSIWASIGTLFMGIFKFVQLGLGLVIALLFCLAVLIAIFLGGMAMISRENAVKMFEQLRQKISDMLLWLRELVIRDMPSLGTRVTEQLGKDLKTKILNEVDASLSSLRNDQSRTRENITAFNRRISDVEDRGDLDSLRAQIVQQGNEMQQILQAFQSLQEKTELLQAQLEELSGLVVNEEQDRLVKDLASRVDELRQADNTLHEGIDELKKMVQAGMEKKRTPAAPEGHRLFVYLKDKAMKEKVEKLVTETLGTDMSYAQVIDHLIKQIGGETAKTIDAHPKLVRNYIKYRRDNG